MRNRHIYVCEVDTYIYEERSFLCPVVRNRSVKIAKIDQHDGIAAGFGIAAAILKIVSKSQKQARYGTEKNVSQMCGTKMNAHFSIWGTLAVGVSISLVPLHYCSSGA